jgi:adenosine deaminase
MRQADRSLEAARTALAFRDDGVVGFDIAGPEVGFPATDHAEAFALLREALFPFTVHAGEAVGPESVAGALSVGASRIGHGVRVLEDVVDGTGGAHLGRVAAYVRDRQVPLEVCPRSNVQTGAAPSIAAHQATALRDLGMTVTLSSDDRLWTGTTLTDEMLSLVEHAGWTWDDLRQVTLDALDAAFVDQPTRLALLEHVVVPGWER